MKTKRCTKCGDEKALREFYRNKTVKDGYDFQCKICRKKTSKQYRQANPEKVRESHRKYRQANPEKYRGYAQKYRQANPEKVNSRRRKHRQKYLDILRKKEKVYYENNDERIKARARKQSKKSVNNLSDSYIRKKICRGTSLKAGDIPKQLIEAKREYLKLGRLIKGLENEEHERSKKKIG